VTIAPEFVDHRSFTLPRLIYCDVMLDGPTIDGVAPAAANVSFVYHVFDADGDLLYVGLTATPRNRWDAHRRKARWWSRAAYLHLHEVRGRDRNTADMGARHWERMAIHNAMPLFNVLGPADLPAKASAR
jgi:hypothetical protein